MELKKQSWQFKRRKTPITLIEVMMKYGDKKGKMTKEEKQKEAQKNTYIFNTEDYEKLS